MKKVFILFTLVLFVCGCEKSQTEIAKGLAQEFMEKHVHDKSSYEIVDFGDLDSTYTNILSDSLYKRCLTKRLTYQKLRNELYNESQLWRNIDKERYSYYHERTMLYADSVSYYFDLENKAKNDFKPVFGGYVIKHTFRAKNELGNLILNVCAIQFDPGLTRVTSVSNWDEYTNYKVEDDIEEFINSMIK